MLSKLSKEELKLQQALGTKEQYCFISADWKDIDGLADGFIKACENFGVYVYEDPNYEGTDCYGYIITDHEMTDEEIKIETGYYEMHE